MRKVALRPGVNISCIFMMEKVALSHWAKIPCIFTTRKSSFTPRGKYLIHINDEK
jgi:hypothetical protein